MPIISVIIPVYNVMSYIDCCIESVVNQSFSDIEIICVDDCSTDASKQIILKWMSRDKRISLISFENNRGLSAARNAGLDIASGKYIYFIDSDDWVDPRYLEAMHYMAEKSGCEIVINTHVLGVCDGEIKEQLNKMQATPEGVYWDRISALNKKFYDVWDHLYKLDFLRKNNLRFPEGYIFESAFFFHLENAYVDRVFAFIGPPYFYRSKRPGSITTSLASNIPRFKTYELVLKFYRDNPNIECDGVIFFDTRKILILNNDDEMRQVRKFYKINLPFLLARGFRVDDQDKFLLKCLFTSDNLSELNQRIYHNKKFSFYETLFFLGILLRYTKVNNADGYVLFAKQLIWKTVKDHFNPLVSSDSKIRKVYRLTKTVMNHTMSLSPPPLWKATKDMLNSNISSNSWIRKAYRALRFIINKVIRKNT